MYYIHIYLYVGRLQIICYVPIVIQNSLRRNKLFPTKIKLTEVAIRFLTHKYIIIISYLVYILYSFYNNSNCDCLTFIITNLSRAIYHIAYIYTYICTLYTL